MSENKNRSFLTDFENFREFLKVNFDYCSLSSEKIGDYIEKIGKTKYNEYKNKAEYIGSKRIVFPKINGKKAFKYDLNQFESDYNELADSFQLKTLTAYEANCIIYLLVLLYDNPMSANDILDKLNLDDRKTVDKHLKNMSEYGLLEKNKSVYSVPENPFRNMDEDTLLKILNYVDFMKNIISPQALGYFLFNSIKGIYEAKTGKDYLSPFQFRYSHLANILDDDVMWTLLNAIHQRKLISYTYRDKSQKTICPVKIFTENEYNRIYLFGINQFGRIKILRISKMYNTEILKKENISEEQFSEYLKKYECIKKYSFSGKLDSVNKCEKVRLKFYKMNTKKQIAHDFGSVEFIGNNIAEVTIAKKNMIIPWLRSNLGQVEVLDEELSAILKNDIMEMKKIYGIIS
jgi:predicted DNA-binding transcriptional regulator YafY